MGNAVELGTFEERAGQWETQVDVGGQAGHHGKRQLRRRGRRLVPARVMVVVVKLGGWRCRWSR